MTIPSRSTTPKAWIHDLPSPTSSVLTRPSSPFTLMLEDSMTRTPAIPTMTLEDMITTRRMNNQQLIPVTLFHVILANILKRAHELMIQDAKAVLELGPQIANQLSDWANDMREHCFTPAETAEIMDQAGQMTNGYFVTLAIVNRYWNLLLTRTANTLEATNISNPLKTSMHKLRMSVGMQDWLFTIKTKQEWLDFGESSEISVLSRH
jgi:hypothetical protein